MDVRGRKALVVGGGSGDNDANIPGSYHNPEGGNAGGFIYFRNINC